MHKHLTGRLVFVIASHSTPYAADVTVKSGCFICPKSAHKQTHYTVMNSAVKKVETKVNVAE